MIADRANRRYSSDEVIALLEKAEQLGFNLEKGSELEKMTIAEVDEMLSKVGRA